jgi:hypothetical protein
MIELTYKLYLEAISHGINPKSTNVNSVDDTCSNISSCNNCPFEVTNEAACIIEIVDNPQELFDSYYQRALKNNPEYLL